MRNLCIAVVMLVIAVIALIAGDLMRNNEIVRLQKEIEILRNDIDSIAAHSNFVDSLHYSKCGWVLDEEYIAVLE